jgi:hypothetical protein
VPIERPRAYRKMAEILHGNPIDFKAFATDLDFTTRFAREVLELHAERAEIPSKRRPQGSKLDNLVHMGDKRSGQV